MTEKTEVFVLVCADLDKSIAELKGWTELQPTLYQWSGFEARGYKGLAPGSCYAQPIPAYSRRWEDAGPLLADLEIEPIFGGDYAAGRVYIKGEQHSFIARYSYHDGKKEAALLYAIATAALAKLQETKVTA